MVDRYADIPLSFEANIGQAAEPVKFISRGSGYGLFLTPTEAAFVMRGIESLKQSLDSRAHHFAVLRMKLVGANPAPRVEGEDELPGKAHYFVGNDPGRWRTGAPTYRRVRYEEVYPGIDLAYYGNQRSLEYDFVVGAGADPRRIVLSFGGADSARVDVGGNLVLRVGGGEIVQRRPITYQVVEGERREIESGYVTKGGGEVGFYVGEYDPSLPLVIDPVLIYSNLNGRHFRTIV